VSSDRFTKSSLATAVLVALVGCASAPDDDELISSSARYSGTTLADLEGTDITIEEQGLENVSAEMALESYRRAVKLFQDPEKRARSIRRMADLAMESAEQKTLTGGEEQSLAETPQVSSDNEEMDRNIDKMLYENFMREAQKTENREEKYALLDMAGNMASSLDQADLETDYETAILLYQTLLESTEDPAERAEAYYLLAKAYNMAGEPEKSRASLDKLVNNHPDSKYYVEAQFRRGEDFFATNEYDSARSAYEAVAQAGPDTPFYQDAVHMLGWSYYKLAYYEESLTQFFTLVDDLQDSPDLDNEKSADAKLLAEAKRAISLAFTNLDGAESVREWFAENGHRDYESEIYRSLGNIYLQQERFQDAAGAFDMFVTVYPDSPLAPEFSTMQIEAFNKGGFPALVLPAKEKFANHYGISGQYWADHPDIREEYVPLLKGHILDLAKHYHALAQKEKKPEAFNKPARWYSEYLRTPPPSDQEARINHLYAEALFSAERFSEAVAQFERTAYEYENYEEASEAAYFALVAYQAEIENLPESEEEQISALRKSKIESGLKFAANYPEHEKVPQVLYNITEDQLARDDLDGAIKTAGMLVNRKPPPAEELQVYGWQTIANGEFDQGRYKVAEFAYSKLLEYPSIKGEKREQYREQLATSVYKQGEALQEQGELTAAADMFLRVGEVYPQASVRKNADFDAATLFIKQEQYKRAIPVLESFRSRYPDDKLTETVPDKLAVAYEKTGDYTNAAEELAVIAENYDEENQELARQALWRAAEMQDRAERPQKSIELYKKYVWKYQQPWDFRSEAQYRLVNLYEKTGDEEKKRFWLNELVKTYNDAGSEANDRVAWLAAHASFRLAEPAFEDFRDIELTQPLNQSLSRKTAAMKDALAKYESVSEIGVAEYTSAANFKIGQLYRLLAKSMMESERPGGMSDLELAQYDLLLEEKALPYEDQAIDVLISNTDLAHEGIYDTWVKQSFSELAKLLPGRYAKFEQVENYVDIIY
jgi:tetratricopeptide (TPR) repeat protein